MTRAAAAARRASFALLALGWVAVALLACTPAPPVQQARQDAVPAPRDADADVALIEPLYSRLFEPPSGKLDLPAEVRTTLGGTLYATWGIAAVNKVRYRDGSLAYRLLLSSGESTHPSEDKWIGIEIDPAGKVVRAWPEVPRKGPFESNP